uniref:Uncharacterized protein n=1 Tax=Spongospora subterranea TaxID=70186 RepID=A0A0H5R2V5_9EUKA|eukprot:CRZ02239.1 hypothetical protein [Spongospora subterranea]
MTTRFSRMGNRTARNPTGSGPAHLNKFAFKHNPHSAVTKAIAAIPQRRVCSRCYDILEWRKSFRKYKPLKKPRKCDQCNNQTIITSYHVICEQCSHRLDACSKCKAKFTKEHPLRESEIVIVPSEEEVACALAGYKERHRRSMIRAIQNGVMTLEQVLSSRDAVGNPRPEMRLGSQRQQVGTDQDGSDHQSDDSDLDSEESGDDAIEEGCAITDHQISSTIVNTLHVSTISTSSI